MSFQKLLLLSVLVSAAANQIWSCPEKCRCTRPAGKTMTNCSYSDLTRIPTLPLSPGVGSDEEALDLTGNPLTEIPRNAFRNAHLLHKLLLRLCELSSIDKQGLKSLGVLALLDLSENHLTTLHSETFQELVSITIILLNDNQLEKLEDGLFSNLPQLQRLDLNRNKIVGIASSTFTNSPRLTYMKLDSNRLEYLNVDILKNFTFLYRLDLFDNPWRCDCKLQPLTDWAVSNYFNASQIVCAEPANLRGKSSKDLDANDFACQPDIVNIANTTVSASTSEPIETSNTNHTLTCQVNGNPLPALHWTPNSQWEVKYYVCGDYLCMAKMVEERVIKLSTATTPSAV